MRSFVQLFLYRVSFLVLFLHSVCAAVGAGPTGAVTSGSIGPIGMRGETGSTGSTGPGAPYSIGDYAQGGVVFWVDPSGEHGLVAAILDQDDGTGVVWYNGSYILVSVYANGLYMGAINTASILSAQMSGVYASSVAANYSVTIEGVTYGNWYLPSNLELALMYEQASVINATAIANGGTDFLLDPYWSSNENPNSANYAWAQNFRSGDESCEDKSALIHVRAIRAF